MICREINCVSRFEYHILYVLYQFVTYLLTLPVILKQVVHRVNTVICIYILITERICTSFSFIVVFWAMPRCSLIGGY
jgi:hypothetical protein